VNSMNRRQFLGGSSALFGAGVLGLAGCGPGTGSSSDGATSIQFAWWGNPERDKRTRAAIQAYEKRHKDVAIRDQVTNWDDYWDKLATNVAGGNPPDLIQMDYAYITEYARNGQLLALDEYVPGRLPIDDFDERSLNSGKVDDKLYGATMAINSVTMLYNETLIADAGLELPSDDELTWSGYADFAKQLTSATPDDVWGSPNGMLSDVPFECWLRQRGKALYTADGQLGFEPSDMEEWFTFWTDLQKAGAIPPPEMEIETTGDIADALIVKGQTGFTFNWSNQLVAFNTASPDTITMHMFPQGDGPDAQPGQFYKASMLLSVAAQSENQDAAVELTSAFLTDPEFAGHLGFERGVPPKPSVRDALTEKASADDKATVDYILEIEDKIGETPPPPPQGATKVDEAFTFAVEETAYGRVSVQDAVDKFFTDSTEALSG
jgi:multiple sugar transport system substrate-binding protein